MTEIKEPTKAELFAKNPDDFYHKDDLKIAITNDYGVMFNTRSAKDVVYALFIAGETFKDNMKEAAMKQRLAESQEKKLIKSVADIIGKGK